MTNYNKPPKVLIWAIIALAAIAICNGQTMPKDYGLITRTYTGNPIRPDTIAVTMITIFDFQGEQDRPAQLWQRLGYEVSHPDSLRVKYLDSAFRPMPSFMKVLMSWSRKKPECKCETNSKYFRK